MPCPISALNTTLGKVNANAKEVLIQITIGI